MTLIVALHGFLGQSQDYEGLSQALAGKKEVDVWAPDLFALGSQWSPHLSLENWADQLNRHVVELKKYDRRIILGYSLGGRLGFQALHQQPEVWDSSLLISCNPLKLREREREARALWDRKWAEKFRSEPWEVLIKDWNSLDLFAHETGAPPRRFEDDYDRETLALALEKWSPIHQRMISRHKVEQFKNCHWLVGLQDRKYLAIQEKISELMPNAEYWQAPGGHRLVHQSHPVPFWQQYLTEIV
jgi:2-succinyl-6-hydroxy-2,4-cyclohexadiene-1-carboxylate synthase